MVCLSSWPVARACTLHFIIKNMFHNKKYGSMDLLLELLLELLLKLLLVLLLLLLLYAIVTN